MKKRIIYKAFQCYKSAGLYDAKKIEISDAYIKKYEPLFYFWFSIWLQTDSNNTMLKLAQSFQSYDNPKANFILSLLTGVWRVRTLNSIT